MTGAVDALLERFFGIGNDLDPVALAAESPDLAAWLNGRVSDLRTEPTGTHLLPRRWSGRTTWYALAHSARQARALRQELQAFVGASYAQVDRAQPLDPIDEVEAAVLEFTGGHGFSFDVVPSTQANVRSSLDLLASLRRARPLRSESAPKPLGRLLRDFEMAVVAGDEGLSTAMLDAIEQSGLLTTQNVLFLRIRRLAALERHSELLTLPELGPLLSIRRPARVTDDLVTAVYLTELRGFEVRKDAPGALAHFDTNVLRRFPALFRSRQGVVTPEAVKAFAVQLVASGPFDESSLGTLRDTPDLTSEDREWITELGRHGTTVDRGGDPAVVAIDAVRDGRFDDGLHAALAMPVGLEQAELVLRCAVEIDSLDAIRSAFETVSQLDEADRDVIEGSRWLAGAWAHVRSVALGTPDRADVAAEPVARGWAELFECIAAGTVLTPASVAESGVVEWSIEAFSTDEVARISNAIAATPPEGLARVSDALPYLLQFLDRAEDQHPHQTLVDDISLLLLSEETLRVADLHVLVGLLTTLLELGIEADRYTTLVNDFLALWRRTEAPSHLDGALELLDVLVAAPAPSPEARMLLLQTLLASFQRWRRRVRTDQWALLDDLADELGVPDATATLRPSDDSVETVEDDVRDALKGRTVAIYTLTEPAAQRAASFLSRHFANVRVELAHDHVASDRLRALAESADLFVVATRSAKHAATTYIQTHRPRALPTVYPSGKGSASIIRSVFGFVAAER